MPEPDVPVPVTVPVPASGGWWMTANSDLISRRNCIYVTHSGRVCQTAHSSEKMVMVPPLYQLQIPLLHSKNLNFWHLSSRGWWMTGIGVLISTKNCIYVTESDRGNQTAHSSDKIVKMSRLDHLLLCLFLDLCLCLQAGDGVWQPIATKFLNGIVYVGHVLVQVIKLHTSVIKWLRYLVWISCQIHF